MSDKDPRFLEDVLLKFMYTNEEVRDKVIPFLDVELFDRKENVEIVKHITSFMKRFTKFPNVKESKIDLESVEVYDHLKNIMNIDTDEYSGAFLLGELEDFFKRKMISNVCTNTIISLNDDDLQSDYVDKLRSSFAFSFDTSIGMDVFGDDRRMFDFFHSKRVFVPSTIRNFDRIVDGGFHTKSLTLFLAGCVTKDTAVNIRVLDPASFCVVDSGEFAISKVGEFLLNYMVQVDSPDGWVDVIGYVEKGSKPIFKITTPTSIVRASYDHLFETNLGWVFSEDLDPEIHTILTDTGFSSFLVEYCDYLEEVVDLSIDHENHRYYTSHLSSHNTNVGKSLIMASLAVSNVFDNKKVLYITCEMSEDKIAERVYANAMNIPVRDMKNVNEETFFKKSSVFKKKFSHNFFLKEFPTGNLNTNMIRNLIKEFELKQKFKPDIIYLDYLALMRPSFVTKNSNSYESLKYITEELRGLAVEMEIPIVSAVQTGRGGIDSSDLDLTDIAESIGTAFTADIVVAVTQSEEMATAGKYLWKVLKNRYGPKNVRITALVDYDYMRVSYDRESDADYITGDGLSPEKTKDREVDAAASVVTKVRDKSEKTMTKNFMDFE